MQRALLRAPSAPPARRPVRHEVVDLDRDPASAGRVDQRGGLLDRLGPVHLRALRAGSSARCSRRWRRRRRAGRRSRVPRPGCAPATSATLPSSGCRSMAPSSFRLVGSIASLHPTPSGRLMQPPRSRPTRSRRAVRAPMLTAWPSFAALLFIALIGLGLMLVGMGFYYSARPAAAARSCGRLDRVAGSTGDGSARHVCRAAAGVGASARSGHPDVEGVHLEEDGAARAHLTSSRCGIVAGVLLGLVHVNMGSMSRPGDLVAAARAAEAAGFDSVWAGEHIVLPDPQVPPSPMAPAGPGARLVARADVGGGAHDDDPARHRHRDPPAAQPGRARQASRDTRCALRRPSHARRRRRLPRTRVPRHRRRTSRSAAR